jgi:hypothetical protein
MRDGDQLISHVLSELRTITDLRVEMAEWRGWRRNTDLRVESLEKKSTDSQKRLEAVEKSGGFASLMLQNAKALLQWAGVMVLVALSAAKMLPSWVEPLVSALARAK